MLFVRPVAVALSVVLAGCAAIPELEFDDDAGDGAAGHFQTPRSDASVAIDGGPSTALDAEPVAPESNDASQNADTSPPPSPTPTPTPDAAPPPPALGCPTTIPAGATMCCGLVACVGNKCAAHCADCGLCAGSTCCVTPNGKTTTCAANAASCPHGD